MKSGPELDAAVAERVMGQAFRDGPRPGERVTRICIMPYSTDIVFAWQVVERLIADGWTFELGHAIGKDYSPWLAWLYHDEGDKLGRFGDTAPHAISLAALAAMEWR